MTSTIGQDKLAELVNEIHFTGFFCLDITYSAPVTDNSTMGGKRKHGVSYTTAAHRLHILMDRIDQIVYAAQWIGDKGR